MEFDESFDPEKAPESIGLDDVVELMEFEYGVTTPDHGRPVLRTRGIGYSPKSCCTGFALLDSETTWELWLMSL